ncbi:MAG: T9SS type A sorting domain-containing protein [Gemmatimonadota bacterium]|nr:T9SS type A sorting domain-containing protein [Gemmatimonadota bacterium]
MSNPSSTSATITWETEMETGGLLRYRTAGTSDPFVTVQENRSLQRLHQVRLIGVLAANTTYEFQAESGGIVSATSTFRTTTSATFAPGGVVVADILRVGGALQVGAEEAMLFVTVKRFDDARRSFPLSVFTDAQGAALITLNLFNDADGQLFPTPRIGDSLFVDVRAGLLGSQKTKFTITSNSPEPIFLGSIVLQPEVLAPVALSFGSAFGEPGDTLSIHLTLSNPNEGKSVAGFQFAITAAHPEWVSYAGLADTSLHGDFVFSTNLMDDTLRVVAYSPTDGSIAPGTEIHVVTVLGLLDDAVPLGNKNQLFVSQTEVVGRNGGAFPDTLITGALQAGIPGDMNLSGTISVPDVVTLVLLNIGKTHSPAAGTFAFYIADANVDGSINVADAVYQVNRILGKPIEQPLSRVVYSPVTVDLRHPVTSGTGLAVPLSVITGTPVGGIQLTYSFDPSNITIGTPALTAASSDVSLAWHIEDGTLNVIAYSLEGKAITLGPGGVLIPVTVPEGIRPEITLTNAVLSDLYGNAVPVRLGQTRVSVAAVPTSFSLATARPNPFNPSTTIAYELLEQTHITLTVYNLLGQEVVRLVDQVQAAGRYEAVWNGTNIRGVGVASGIYLYRITSGSGYTESKRMTLLK